LSPGRLLLRIWEIWPVDYDQEAMTRRLTQVDIPLGNLVTPPDYWVLVFLSVKQW
jgi:hypothetical protein